MKPWITLLNWPVDTCIFFSLSHTCAGLLLNSSFEQRKQCFILKPVIVETKNAFQLLSGDEMQMKQMNVCQLFAQVLFKMATNSPYTMYRMFKLRSQIFFSPCLAPQKTYRFSFQLKNSPMPYKNSFAPGKKTTSPLGTALASRKD